MSVCVCFIIFTTGHRLPSNYHQHEIGSKVVVLQKSANALRLEATSDDNSEDEEAEEFGQKNIEKLETECQFLRMVMAAWFGFNFLIVLIYFIIACCIKEKKSQTIISGPKVHDSRSVASPRRSFFKKMEKGKVNGMDMSSPRSSLSEDGMDMSATRSFLSKNRMDMSATRSFPPQNRMDMSLPRSFPPQNRMDMSLPRSFPPQNRMDMSSPRSSLSKNRMDMSSPRSSLSKNRMDMSLPRSFPPQKGMDMSSPRVSPGKKGKKGKKANGKLKNKKKR